MTVPTTTKYTGSVPFYTIRNSSLPSGPCIGQFCVSFVIDTSGVTSHYDCNQVQEIYKRSEHRAFGMHPFASRPSLAL